METIKLVYIDDSPEAALAEYLDRIYKNESFETEYSDIIFDPQAGYDALLKDSRVHAANIVFIDSRLFENTTALGNKFSGEEVKFVLRKFYPLSLRMKLIQALKNSQSIIQHLGKHLLNTTAN